MHRAAGVAERQPIAFEALHDEALAAEQADADLALEGDPDRHAAGRAQERVLLTNQRAAQLLEIHRQDLAGIRRRERHLLLAGPLIGEDGHEEALAGDETFAGTEQRAHHARSLLLRTVAEHRLHLNAGSHVHHRASFGHGALTGIELHFDELHLAAEDAEVDFVRALPGRDRRRRGRSRRRAAGRRRQVGSHGRHVLERRPVRHARRKDERVAVNGAVPQIGDDVFLRHRPDLMAADGHVPLLLCHLLLSAAGLMPRSTTLPLVPALVLRAWRRSWRSPPTRAAAP